MSFVALEAERENRCSQAALVGQPLGVVETSAQSPAVVTDCERDDQSDAHGLNLDEALAAVQRGPMDADELAWMRRVGASVRDATSTGRRMSPMTLIDAIATFKLCAPKQLAR